MKKIFISLGFVFTLIISFGYSDLYAQSKIKWENNLKTALSLAKKEKKIIMIDLYTDWCGWCKELDKRTFTGKEVIETSKKLIALKLNAEKSKDGKELVKKYMVQGYPTIIFINADGMLLKKIVGFLEAPAFNEEMIKALEIPKKLTQIQNQSKVTLEALNLYIEIADVQKASDAFESLVKEKIIAKSQLPFYYLEIGYLYLDARRNAEAKKYFETIIKSYPKSKEVYAADYYYAYILVAENKKSEAKKHIENALKREGVSNKAILEKMLSEIK